MLRIDVCSDLHVDHNPDPYLADGSIMRFDVAGHRNAGASVLVVAGDISDFVDDVYEFAEEASKHYEHIIYVDGNHEHRDSLHVNTSSHFLSNIQTPNFHYLDGETSTSYTIGRTRFIGANAWYDWRCYEDKGITFPMAFAHWDDYSEDAKLNFNPQGWPNLLGVEQITAMLKEVAAANADPHIDSIVMVTHSAPTVECLRWSDDNPSWNHGSPSYVNTGLSQVFDANTSGKIKLWVYGHTHTRRTFTYRGVTLVNNCYGYPGEFADGWTMQVFEV